MTDEQKIMYSTEGMKACPVDTTSKLIGKKYTILLIRNMLSNHKRFNQFLESIEGMNQKILSTRLKEMEREGLVTRKVYAEMPLRVEYFLTEKGLATKPILDQMAAFSLQYCSKDIFEDGKPRTLQDVVH
ncbi:MAG: helix-turn-helix transcriptional regulator [Thermoproteota archaeon]|nr:helix-turn-helix transcriptional regulator [Thermoproteota archaeon]